MFESKNVFNFNKKTLQYNAFTVNTNRMLRTSLSVNYY